ncbi:CYFA0S39e00320g1_1 [Cyberlindnera fabianii]|uniref:CYFA0S39e00320g1_1 n=1 Tax=Cyberlindnera fabianii TaxID=36022 RepID=A0A061BJ19_CYBFA|nr:Protein GVP36 [Cyberlindnera fabianii]CDR47901.1 CYFA0S39e00320g1_1 [Cyberlindnera fabianii]
MSFFQNFSKTFQDGLAEAVKEGQKLSSELSPLAQRTARQLQERLGQTDDISQLPQEYTDLEKKIETLKTVYNNLLSVTSTYETEAYDYPANLRESVTEISKTISTKVEKLANARTTSEAQSILIAQNPRTQPKTLNHAISTSTNLSALKIQQQSTDDSFDLIAQGLTQVGQTEAKIGEARLQQDKLIRTKVNAQFKKQLKENLLRADKSRRAVENKRLSYDAARASLKTAKPEKEASLRVTLETLEDEFAAATEDAVAVMKQTVEGASVLSELVEFITAQLAYHKAASELLEQLLPNLQNLRDDAGGKVLSDVEDADI